jgi:hypothetical protein
LVGRLIALKMASHIEDRDGDSGELMASQLTSPTALRKLVLNYLVHHCYTDTAQAFAHDGISSTPSRAEQNSSISESVSQNSSFSPSGSTAAQPRHSRLTSQQTVGSAHPLSAPPLSRDDSSMEIEVDNLLSLAGGRGVNGNRESAVGNGTEEDTAMENVEAPQNGQSSHMLETNSHKDALGSEELSAEELESVRIRGGECLAVPNSRLVASNK